MQTQFSTEAIRAAGWQCRNQRGNYNGRERRRAALEGMAGTVRAALNSGDEPEAILYAVALALYDRRDPRFQV